MRPIVRGVRSKLGDGLLRCSGSRKRFELDGGNPPPRAAERPRFGPSSCSGSVKVQVHGEVAVGVAHDADALESSEGKAGFLHHLTTTRGGRALSASQLSTGKLPEAAQEARRRATEDEPSTVALDRGHGRDHVRLRGPRSAEGEDAGFR
jgi:hypothetical protein